MTQEGIIQFHHVLQPPTSGLATAPIERFNRLLSDARARDLVGRDPGRYDGLAFGNLSYRPEQSGQGFWMTATQTADRPGLTPAELVWISDWSLAENRVVAAGFQSPSSETLAHAATHEQTSGPCWVLHGHAPQLWHASARLGLPTTPAAAANGTVALASAIRNLITGSCGLLVMGGHQDGMLAYAPDQETLLAIVDRALDQAQLQQ